MTAPPRARTRRGLTARARLTAFYGALFLISGVLLIGLIVFLVFSPTPKGNADPKGIAGKAPAAQTKVAVFRQAAIAKEQARRDLQARLAVSSGLALGAMTVIALGGGWLMAGRVLRPIRAVSAAARRLSERDLHQRIPVHGPDDELTELAETFNGMIARLERAFTAQQLFTANASHELRGPMTTQRALVDVTMATPDASPDARELAGALREVLRRQERLVNGLFELASGQHGMRRRQQVELDAIARDVLARWGPATAGRDLRLTTELAPTTVPGDPALLEILLDNLIRNAITHNVDGGWLAVRTGTGTLTVENTGTALPPARLAELTEPFRRGDRDRLGGAVGAGLGLAIVDTIVRAHQVTLRLLARPGGGLVASVCFGRPAAPKSLKPC